MWPIARESLSSLLDIIFPRHCAACGRGDEQADPLCTSCTELFLRQVGQPYCARCGASVAEGLTAGEDGCSHCPTPMPRFDRVVRLVAYEPPLTFVIRKVKFHGAHSLCRWLAGLLAQKVAATPELASVDVVQPVPLHWRRRMQRTYNQAELIARGMSRRLSLPLGAELVRVRNTLPQGHLPRTRRLENVKGAFAAGRRTSRLLHVLLVDDVTTTGATACEATAAMLAAGAGRVSLAVLAKADPPLAFLPRHG
ncbi:MAG: ComF family protein [Planctomycetes bacterium]|nr:ComF family protein [Planctomycetota bacterium]